MVAKVEKLHTWSLLMSSNQKHGCMRKDYVEKSLSGYVDKMCMTHK
jgi:hypothetical protein